MANNTPMTIFEALLFLWSRAAEGKDRRPLTDDQRRILDAEDPDGTNWHHSFDGVRIFRDADGTPYVRGTWSHAMAWQFFQGRQAGIELLVGEYAGQEYSEFVGLDEKLQGVLKYLDSRQLHFPLFLDYMLDGCPALADEWPAPTDKQPPAQPEIVINLEVQQSARAEQLKPIEQPGGESAAQQVEEQAPEGEWSKPMSKKVLMNRLDLNPRAFKTFTKQHPLRKISRQQWQIRLDTMDSRTRERIETGK